MADGPTPAGGLDFPKDLQIFGKLDPNVRKPTAIVNNSVLTGTDLDQRIAMIAAANQLTLSDADRDRLRLQILRSLIDETLEIQQAKTADITVSQEEINQSFDRVAKNFNKSPAEMRTYLRSIGSSDRTLRRQIEGELAWRRYLQRRVEPSVNVSDEEVAAILARMKAEQGSQEYHLKEIYLSAGPDRQQQVFDTEKQMIADIQKGGKPFEYYAQYSEATTRATGGDLDWISASQLTQLPTSLQQAATTMQVGQIAGPIEVPGGFSILYLVDKRQVLTSDPRDAVLTLKQLTVRFPAGITQADAGARVVELEKATKAMQGCGDVAKVGAQINAEIVENASITARELPPKLQDMVLAMQVGQTTPWYGSPKEGVRALVLCGRDDPRGGTLPQAEQVQNQMEQQRVNLRATKILRDLRRDAVIDYR